MLQERAWLRQEVGRQEGRGVGEWCGVRVPPLPARRRCAASMARLQWVEEEAWQGMQHMYDGTEEAELS